MTDHPIPHVLVVDDEEDIRLSLVMLLEGEGFRCSDAADGAEAIRAVESGRAPDVLLLDYRMPGLSGGETLAALRAAGHRMPAVLLTAAKDADEIGLRYGFDAVLTKPVGPEQLSSTLRAAVARARAALG